MTGPKPASARPATYRDLFASSEFRTLYTAASLSWVGDYLARAAVTALVFTSTGSVALSASSFAVGYLPSLTAGPVLAALAERYPPRRIMVGCDAARAALIAALAVPRVPIAVLFVLLFLAALLTPPFDASRASLLPRVLGGERYVAAISAMNTTNNLMLVLGYFVGGLAGSIDPHVTLGVDAGTFALSGLVIRLGLAAHTANMHAAQRTTLLHETKEGFRAVLGNRIPRSIVLTVLTGSLMVIVPEGLAAAWAAHLSPDSGDRALYQALIMMSVPAGSAVAAVVVGRVIPPDLRRRLIRPFALLVPAAMIGVLANPSAALVTIIGVVAGFAMTAVVIPSNALYVAVMPASFRARAFGVMQFGAQLVQGAGLIATGALSDDFPFHQVIGYWAVGGLVLMAAVVAGWPTESQIGEATAAAAAMAAQPQRASATGGDGVSGVTPTITATPAPAQRHAAPTPGTVGDRDVL